MSKSFTKEEVARHNTEQDCWIIIDGKVYDVTKFAKMHPGGYKLLIAYGGKDATTDFFDMHRLEVLSKHGPRLLVGTVRGSKPSVATPTPGAVSQVPYAESTFWQGWHSPYFNESHKSFRTAVRAFFDKEVKPRGPMLEELGKDPPMALYEKMGDAGILASRLAPGPHQKLVTLPSGLAPEKFDYFHEMIAHEEIARTGLPGLVDGLGAGYVIGLPPIIHFGTKELQKKVVPEVITGRKRICLAISEPFAGSDVANIKTVATKTPDGKHYIVNGVKKWITNGTFADYFVTAVRTGGAGIGGISLLFIERSEGLTTKKIKTSYSGAAGTSYVVYEDVKVPVENLLGKENQGFKCIMYNFNHERWFITVGVNRQSRNMVEECMKWAHQRKVFGKPLISQPVIREKLAHMTAQVEAVQSWLESITFQMTKMTYAEQSRYLAGPIALVKLQATRTATFVNDHACQIFGGRAITRTGMGQMIERNQRAVKFASILGGSEEIMADLGVRQAMKYFPTHAKL